MRNILILFFTVSLIHNASAQFSNTHYALPSDVTEVTTQVSDLEYMLSLSEAGTVPSESKSTCDGRADGSNVSSVAFALEHHVDIKTLKQKDDDMAPRGLKGFFIYAMETEYSGIVLSESDKKGQLVIEQLQGAVVYYYTVTSGCVQDSNPTKTKIVYNAMLLTDHDYLQINIGIYSANVDRAKKYAVEIINKIKTLDYGKVK